MDENILLTTRVSPTVRGLEAHVIPEIEDLSKIATPIPIIALTVEVERPEPTFISTNIGKAVLLETLIDGETSINEVLTSPDIAGVALLEFFKSGENVNYDAPDENVGHIPAAILDKLPPQVKRELEIILNPPSVGLYL